MRDEEGSTGTDEQGRQISFYCTYVHTLPILTEILSIMLYSIGNDGPITYRM
jgi:hypothetical protein